MSTFFATSFKLVGAVKIIFVSDQEYKCHSLD